MLASVRSAVLAALSGLPVTVEVHISNGLPGYTVVGLPDAAVRESRDRVRAALLSSGLPWPQRRVTVNLAPGAIPKSGTGLDLAFAAGVLLAGGFLPPDCLEATGVVGELGRDGSIRPVPGVLALVSALRESGAEAVVVPVANAAEASLVCGVRVLPAVRLEAMRACLKGEGTWPPVPPPDAPPPEAASGAGPEPGDLGDVRGLATARLALAAAAAGGHHLLLTGPPGAGKSLLARCLPSILPPLEPDEALEVTRIRSAAGLAAGGGLVSSRPFRAPHHTASAAALVGGGSRRPHPGEVTLAHRGALFLDELAEFASPVLEALRQPLEERAVRIARQGATLTFPADFVLVAASNPCPCGLGAPGCSCGDAERARYRRRLSAPLLDRFDLRVAVTPASPLDDLGPRSAEVAGAVAEATCRQRARYRDRPWRRNAQVPGGALEEEIRLSAEVGAAVREAALRLGLTGRGFAGARRVARTLADLDASSEVSLAHAALATALRSEVLG
ncbi:MAG: YifB family Mg chelatase-like AAA ATPase [Acidimicrobiia bacterium]